MSISEYYPTMDLLAIVKQYFQEVVSYTPKGEAQLTFFQLAFFRKTMTYILLALLALGGFFFIKQRKDYNSLADQILQQNEELESKAFSYELQYHDIQAKVKEQEAVINALKSNTVDVSSMIDRSTYQKLDNAYESLTEDYLTLKEKHDKLVSNNKSKEVRLGAIAETLTPFLKGFPYDPKALRPLGQPIDYIAFEENEVVFIEVKSGNSRLSDKQRNIRNLIESGNVRFEVHRIDEDGLTIK